MILTSEHICKGIYGYLGEHLLDIVSASDGYEFLVRDSGFVETHNFKRKQSPYTGRVYYVLPAPKNAGISAYFKRLGVKYKGHTFIIDGGGEDDDYMLSPTWKTMQALGDFPRHGYDPRYKARESEMTDIWEERTPVEGFEFTVEPIVYLKKDGVWLIDSDGEEPA